MFVRNYNFLITVVSLSQNFQSYNWVPRADTHSRCCRCCAGVFVPLLARQTNTVYKYFILAHFPPWFYKKSERKQHRNKFLSDINKAWRGSEGALRVESGKHTVCLQEWEEKGDKCTSLVKSWKSEKKYSNHPGNTFRQRQGWEECAGQALKL